MIRIIFGTFIIFADLGSIFSSPLIIDPENSATALGETIGFYGAKAAIVALGIWLIYTGIQKRRAASK